MSNVALHQPQYKIYFQGMPKPDCVINERCLGAKKRCLGTKTRVFDIIFPCQSMKMESAKSKLDSYTI